MTCHRCRKVLPPGAEGAASIDDVKAPEGFDVSLFAGPPQVTYPVCITTSVEGEVFVGVDEQGSLGKDPGRGKVSAASTQTVTAKLTSSMTLPRWIIRAGWSMTAAHCGFCIRHFYRLFTIGIAMARQTPAKC